MTPRYKEKYPLLSILTMLFTQLSTFLNFFFVTDLEPSKLNIKSIFVVPVGQPIKDFLFLIDKQRLFIF